MDETQFRTRTALHIAAAFLAGALVLTVAGGVRADDKAPSQTPQEASKVMRELMKNRVANVGVTAKGKNLNEAPAFKVLARKPALTKYPCTGCHDNSFVDRRVRKLADEHPTLQFDHGNGRMWCYDACHNGRDMDHLVTLRHRQVDYDESYKVCGQCHFERQKDWSFGAHGRRAGAFPDAPKVPEKRQDLKVTDRSRIGHWKGERLLLNCTACHNPHSPAIRPFTPSPAPEVRAGLTRTASTPLPESQEWQRHLAEQAAERSRKRAEKSAQRPPQGAVQSAEPSPQGPVKGAAR
jgi:hypothetical protein